MYHINDFLLLQNDNYINKTINLFCWISNVRIHKNIIFLVLRNNNIELQAITKEKVIVNNILDITKESYIEVTGILQKRSESNINKNQYLGHIEMIITNVKIINACKKLDLDIAKSDKDNYNIKCSYRYLDLRNNIVKQNILFRSTVIRVIREKMSEHGFIEIQTPLFTKNSVEGANSYLVISSKFPGYVYALVQSPQIYKQLIMCSGINKYFQIAPCFRDEDSRQNRLPSEFYQLDIELCHINNEEEIILLVDKIIIALIKQYGYTDKILYQKISYKDAMKIYGCDKVDMRIIKELDLEYKDNIIEIKFNNEINNYFNELQYKCEVNKEKTKLKIYVNPNNIENTYSLLSKFIQCDYISYCWINDFPMFEYDKIGNLKFKHNPFAKPINPDDNVDQIISKQYDIIINGQEIGGGSIRNIDYKLFIKMWAKIGYTEQQIDNNFHYFINAMQSGMPYHGGIAVGIERLCCLLKNNNNIRDFVCFPMLQNGYDIMMGSPLYLDKNQSIKYGFIPIPIKKNEF